MHISTKKKNKTITNTHNKCNTSVFRLQPRTFVKILSEKNRFLLFFRGLWNTNKNKEKFFPFKHMCLIMPFALLLLYSINFFWIQLNCLWYRNYFKYVIVVVSFCFNCYCYRYWIVRFICWFLSVFRKNKIVWLKKTADKV